MSIAGILSNRGDIYQTLVAFDWALTVLSDPEFQWLEIDSTTYLVDDVVIGKSDGSLICCQCKKNQTNFKAWSIADLVDELDKAVLALAENKQVQVRFYSRSNFGSLAKLREFSTLHSNEADYLAKLPKKHKKTNSDLADRIADNVSNLSTYEFLCRTSFETTPDFDRMEMLIHERLRQMASNSDAAFNALCICLDKLGGRLEDANLSASTQHRLTKDDLKDILHRSGAMLVPSMDISEVRKSFARTSVIGRHWHRDIAGERISSPIVDELLAAIDAKKRAVLLTGLPGSGKTCVMLSLQEALEQRMRTRADLVPLFIQSREFADLVTAQDRQAQGLPEQWVEQVARLSENAHVVVVIDSLDVLSIAREHSILTYFLAQIDQLLLIPNVTVITACRDFDRKFDRRIAARQWDCELQCLPLDWETEIVPLLDKVGIDSTTIDSVTRELIRNPRELALFVELAQREGSFNVVTSQALAQRYLDTIVKADPALGDAAMQAIEDIADAMLKSRSLSISNQRFNASQDILRRLHSLNVLLDTHDGKLTFGHQTLLDVLVISGAVRRGVSLNEFIQGLPPVPFVRPSIRSFVAQLATGERREFRKQLRTVLTGNAAFHIRRLIAESFSQQIPQDDDWPLIRYLHANHREVFQVIYNQASMVEWHHFWLSHLVPALKEMRDAEGLITHVHRIAQWANEDAAGILAFWMDVIALDWLDGNRIAEQLVFSLSDFRTENLPLVVPLLKRLLSIPQPDHSLLGRTVARSVTAGVIDDKILWKYITSDITDDDVVSFNFNNKLRCQPHEFGDKDEDFLKQRMVESTAFLDLALETIEQWSQLRSKHYGDSRIGYRSGFLNDSSYSDVHTEVDLRHKDSIRVLLDAVEAAILNHAQNRSDWWQKNCERVCFSHEGALCYFAILALTSNPGENIDLISRLLCDRDLLEFQLSYELGTLIQTSFIYLDSHIQDSVMATIQTLWDEEPETNGETRLWVLKNRAEYISTIPCHMRSSETQAILDAYEKINGSVHRQPHIGMRGGTVAAPFSYEVFLNASDGGILHLIAHYNGHAQDFDDFLVGGEREVGWQLREASSRHPSRFLELLISNWKNIPSGFCNDIMDGIASYLAYRYGNLKTNATWVPIDEPDAPTLASQILDELERHPAHWKFNRSAANALEACAHVIQDTQAAARLVFLSIGFGKLTEESTIHGDSVDLLTTGINMITGKIVEALMILVNNFQEQNIALPELLPPTLHRFANKEHPAIRALILRRLPYLQSRYPELGWGLFGHAMVDSVGLWKYAERCLYYAYHDHFEKVAPRLERILSEGSQEDMETWGRISALSALTGHISFANLLRELKALDITKAWQGAASVWSHPENIKQHREQCLTGIEAGLKTGSRHAVVVARHTENIFRDKTPPISIPVKLIQLFFNVLEVDGENKNFQLFGFNEWLNAISQRDPDLALAATEIYLAYVSRANPYFYDHKDQLVQLVTRLFAEAEEREEYDNSGMLKRVVSVQDLLLSLGVNSINDWLKMAERQ
ncbi:ATP-binding protein [Microbulbifer thermotolerans]|uniref:AAA family ATPase n=1 Tax=Microbulbifer thermotolerans TaxID=252514 RepID=UPI002672469A|nr:ATP-binding protein [Microbulbifer thermotolerans]WKT61912.1 ATP-binding protein [Microbulbifer thermotolerans]